MVPHPFSTRQRIFPIGGKLKEFPIYPLASAKSHKFLVGPQFSRQDKLIVEEAAASLGVPIPSLLLSFFRRFRDPIGSDAIGYQLLDLAEGKPTILSMTTECRKLFDFPRKILALSDLNAGALLALDCYSGHVYDLVAGG